jgi:hypothetical protein
MHNSVVALVSSLDAATTVLIGCHWFMGKHRSYVPMLFGTHVWAFWSPSSLRGRIAAVRSPILMGSLMMSPLRARMNDLQRCDGALLAGIRIKSQSAMRVMELLLTGTMIAAATAQQ